MHNAQLHNRTMPHWINLKVLQQLFQKKFHQRCSCYNIGKEISICYGLQCFIHRPTQLICISDNYFVALHVNQQILILDPSQFFMDGRFHVVVIGCFLVVVIYESSLPNFHYLQMRAFKGAAWQTQHVKALFVAFFANFLLIQQIKAFFAAEPEDVFH